MSHSEWGTSRAPVVGSAQDLSIGPCTTNHPTNQCPQAHHLQMHPLAWLWPGGAHGKGEQASQPGAWIKARKKGKRGREDEPPVESTSMQAGKLRGANSLEQPQPPHGRAGSTSRHWRPEILHRIHYSAYTAFAVAAGSLLPRAPGRPSYCRFQSIRQGFASALLRGCLPMYIVCLYVPANVLVISRTSIRCTQRPRQSIPVPRISHFWPSSPLPTPVRPPPRRNQAIPSTQSSSVRSGPP